MPLATTLRSTTPPHASADEYVGSRHTYPVPYPDPTIPLVVTPDGVWWVDRTPVSAAQAQVVRPARGRIPLVAMPSLSPLSRVRAPDLSPIA